MDYRITVHYRRDEGDTCTGKFVTSDTEETFTIDQPFEKITYKKMLIQLSKVVSSVAITELDSVLFQRTDRAGLLPIQIDPTTVNLLRHDLVSAIKALTWEKGPEVVDLSAVRKAKEKEQATFVKRQPVFVAGMDAFAEAFSDVVWCAAHDGKVECPFCGRWAPKHMPSFFVCAKCGGQSPYIVRGDAWVGFNVAFLAMTDATRFYLPRGWNLNGPWISNQDLTQLYASWLKEKENAS